MNKIGKRDEFNDRLSSFLFKKGNLEFNEISIIKPHVFYIKTITGDKLILKKHRKKENVVQQWDFFEQLNESNVVPFISYPNGQKIISTKNYYWTITPYIRGDKLNYERSDDRDTAVKSLQNFHDRASHIYVAHPIEKDNIFIRWYHRLLSFKKTEAIFKEHDFEPLYKDIVEMTLLHLQLMAHFPWDLSDERAMNKGLWIHGDVASHNFIQGKDTYLIDFDLLQCTSQIYDYIQLGQRFLPYLNWNLEELLSHQIVKDSDLEAWLSAMLIPSDLLREWLYFVYKGKTGAIYNYLCDMEKAWIKRRYFWKNAKSMLKSL